VAPREYSSECGTCTHHNCIRIILTLSPNILQGGALYLQRSLGSIALLAANAASMFVRIVFTGSYIRKRFKRLGVNSKLNLPSKTYFAVRHELLSAYIHQYSLAFDIDFDHLLDDLTNLSSSTIKQPDRFRLAKTPRLWSDNTLHTSRCCVHLRARCVFVLI